MRLVSITKGLPANRHLPGDKSYPEPCLRDARADVIASHRSAQFTDELRPSLNGRTTDAGPCSISFCAHPTTGSIAAEGSYLICTVLHVQPMSAGRKCSEHACGPAEHGRRNTLVAVKVGDTTSTGRLCTRKCVHACPASGKCPLRFAVCDEMSRFPRHNTHGLP